MMRDIINLVLLGLIAGGISGLWTRIIKRNMILHKVGRKLERIDDMHRVRKGKASPWVKFLFCGFCIVPWLFFLFALWYLITYTPPFIPLVIGVLGGLGGGNLIAEEIHSIREGE
jgi:hypothetical protein